MLAVSGPSMPVASPMDTRAGRDPHPSPRSPPTASLARQLHLQAGPPSQATAPAFHRRKLASLTDDRRRKFSWCKYCLITRVNLLFRPFFVRDWKRVDVQVDVPRELGRLPTISMGGWHPRPQHMATVVPNPQRHPTRPPAPATTTITKDTIITEALNYVHRI